MSNPDMKAMLRNLVSGIDADCGEKCFRATDDRLIERDWMNRVGAGNDRKTDSPLACQMIAVDELSRLVVNFSKTQY
mgnify:CR=1 FL=1|jgi:hypothetical protein|tara:strand:- start:1336 stop:1566 length:231 start_codon:yes stop_codon:yes gene_type:complete